METRVSTGTLDTTLAKLAALLGGELLGPPDHPVARVADSDSPEPEGIAFAESAGYVERAKASGVGALLIGPDLDPLGIPAIRVASPRQAFLQLLLASDRPMPLAAGVHRTAIVDPGARVEPGAEIGPYAVIEAGATVRAGAKIFAHAYVGPDCEVGSGAQLYPHAVLLRNVTLGARATVMPGAVLGGDGFGFVWDGRAQVKIPQVGRVAIEEDAEIGALSAVDRATAGTTRIGYGVKLDNLVQIGHNCTVGEHTVIAAMTGVGGSTRIGRRNMIGGLSGFSDHSETCDDVMLGGRAGVIGAVTEPGAYMGFPVQPASRWRRNFVLAGRLTELAARVHELEERSKR